MLFCFISLKEGTMVNIIATDSMDYYVSNPSTGMTLTNITYNIDKSNMHNFTGGYDINISHLYWHVSSSREFSA